MVDSNIGSCYNGSVNEDLESTWAVTILNTTYEVTTTTYDKARRKAAELYKQEKKLVLSISDIARNARAVKISSPEGSARLEIVTTRKTTYLVRKYLEEKFQKSFQSEVTLKTRQKLDLLCNSNGLLVIAEVKRTVLGALEGPVQLISYKEQITDPTKEVKLFLAIPNKLVKGLKERNYYKGLLQSLSKLGISLLVAYLDTRKVKEFLL